MIELYADASPIARRWKLNGSQVAHIAYPVSASLYERDFHLMVTACGKRFIQSQGSTTSLAGTLCGNCKKVTK